MLKKRNPLSVSFSIPRGLIFSFYALALAAILKRYAIIIRSAADTFCASKLLSCGRKTHGNRPSCEDGGIPDYGLDDFFDEGLVPENKKQIVPKPPTYEESLKDILEGKKQIYVDPQYFPEKPQDLPPEYEEDEEIDYALNEEDSDNMILDDLGLSNYDDIEKRLNQPEMTQLKIKKYVNKKLKDAEFRRNQLKGHKSQVSQAYNKGKIGEAQKTMDYKRIDNASAVLNQYFEHYGNKVKMMEGSGLKKRGGNIVFFNDVKQLIKDLELIVGGISAGNTSIEMRNTGVAILDMLLKTSKINKAQHEKLYKTYFKI